MIFETQTLSSAARLSAVKTDRFKTETLSVSMVLPVDPVQSPMFLLALSVLKRGTEKFPTQGDLNKELDTLFATAMSLKSNRVGNHNLIGFSAEMLCEKYTDPSVRVFEKTLDLMSQMLFHPLMDEDGLLCERYVEGEKTVQCDSIEAQINNPRAYAMKRCCEVMFEDSLWGVSLLGTVEGVRAITRRALSRAYRKLVYGSRYEFFYVGPRNIGEVAEKVSEMLLPALDRELVFALPMDCVWSRTGEVKRVDERISLAQSRLILAFRTGTRLGDKAYFSTLVFNEIYGASPISKLFMNVRERLGLCYQCGSAYDGYSGVIFASSGIDLADREKAEAEMLHQREEICAGKVTDAEFEAAKRSLISRYRAVGDSPSAIASFYMVRSELGIFCTPWDCIREIEAVTLSDVVEAAKKTTLDTVYCLEGVGGEEGEETDDDND